MRYTLTDEELLVIQQDQIDFDLREIEALKAERERATEDVEAGAPTRAAVQVRLDVVEAAHAKTVTKAKATEARVKAKKPS